MKVNLALKISLYLVAFAGFLKVSKGDGEGEVIDLQELLKAVSSTMKDTRNVLETCRSSLKALTTTKPRDCADLWYSGIRNNGIYRVWPERTDRVGSFEVYCDMVTDGGGWTVFQKRGDYGNPQDYFYKTWNEYKNGFGQLDKEFWLGNDRIFALTNQDDYELRVDLWDMEQKTVHAKYSHFWIENEDQQYRLMIKGYSGDAGDDLSAFKEIQFTTKDRKNDQYVGEGNCATLFKGAWWYTACHSSNLNGQNLRGAHETYADGIEWHSFKGHYYSLAATEMKIRPTDFLKKSQSSSPT